MQNVYERQYLTSLATCAKNVMYVMRLCLNPTVQKDNRGVLVASFRVDP